MKMLNVRHIFRKQSAQCYFTRPSLFFSSNAGDSNSKPPPKEDKSDIDSLDAVLSATYSKKQLPRSASHTHKSISVKSAQKGVLATLESDSHDDSLAGATVKKVKDKVPLEELLQSVYSQTKTSKSDAKLEDSIPSESNTTHARTINVALKEKQQGTNTELLSRLKKIAEDVAVAAGPKSKEVAEDLIKSLEKSTKVQEKPIDLHELTFEKGSNVSTDQNLDLLRNHIMSEEQVYKITASPQESHFQRPVSQRSMQAQDQWFMRPPTTNVSRNLHMSLHPKTRLQIFQPKVKENLKTKSCLHTYEKLEQRDMDLMHSFAPRNWFEQCIQWTEQGKLWHFPIDNEQGLTEGQTVSFTEHIFLEDHLEGWCPTFGPVRHFMELVCLGLSKNPYLSVEEKIENIMWYRDYFEKHRELLEAAGTLNSGITKVPALEAQ